MEVEDEVEKKLAEANFEKRGEYYEAVIPIGDYVRGGYLLDYLREKGINFLVYEIDIENRRAEYWLVNNIEEVRDRCPAEADYEKLLEDIMSGGFSWADAIFNASVQ